MNTGDRYEKEARELQIRLLHRRLNEHDESNVDQTWLNEAANFLRKRDEERDSEAQANILQAVFDYFFEAGHADQVGLDFLEGKIASLRKEATNA